MSLVVRSPLKAESLGVHELLIALRGQEKVAAALTSIEVFVFVAGGALVARLLDGAEHGPPVRICQVILLVVGEFTIDCYLLVHIQTVAAWGIGKSCTDLMI